MQEPCSLVSNYKKLPACEDDEISIVDCQITKHVTTEALEALGANLKFIDICIKLLEENYDSIRVTYITDMK